MDYARHIERICTIESIEITKHSRGGRSWRKPRRIAIRPVKSAVTYAIALHEIGHIMGKRQSGVRLDAEVGAWEWAMANALQWDDTMNATMKRCLRSYLRWAASSKQAKRPATDHPIHLLAA